MTDRFLYGKYVKIIRGDKISCPSREAYSLEAYVPGPGPVDTYDYFARVLSGTHDFEGIIDEETARIAWFLAIEECDLSTELKEHLKGDEGRDVALKLGWIK
jgi:hypothetical protein